MSTFFAPHLFIKNVKAGMEFYKNAFEAIDLRKWSNADGSVHVAEMAIDGVMFHLHEEVNSSNQLSPETVNATTSSIGLFVANPDSLVKSAVVAGARVLNPIQDFEYGYRQGVVIDPFGHHWLIQKKI